MPNRILKDSIRTSKSINALNDFQFRLWAYLITYVDDFGRGRAELDILKGFVFPRRGFVTEEDIQTALTVLAGMGLVHLYEVDGDSYLCLRNWEQHQNRRATTSKYPAPPDDDITCEQMQADDSRCMQAQADSPDTRYSILDTRNTILDNDQTSEKETDGFDDFWKVYPRKVSKQTALKAWKGAKAGRIAEQIIADVQRRCETEWKGQELQYIPHPATYLNQRRWEDETPPQVRGSGRAQSYEKPKNPALDYEQRVYTEEDEKEFERASEDFLKKWAEENADFIKRQKGE